MTTNFPAEKFIVVGGGLAGLSALNTLLEHGARVILLEKNAICGGNSTKATSGINGSETNTQKLKGIKDTNEIFIQDTMRGGAKKPEIVKVLCSRSGGCVDWLEETFKLDLSLVARLGGHSVPRTHRGKERFPGMTITYALLSMADSVQKANPHLCQIIVNSRVVRLLTNSSGDVVGVEYKSNKSLVREMGVVIIATGGFGADFTKDSLLTKHRPDLLHLPTTNGEHCTGDGIKISTEIGANVLDLEWVQVHPTGLVNENDPDAKVKFLAAEALRGVGGILVDNEGSRFANELGRRDYVTQRMWDNKKPPYRLVLNEASAHEIHWHCEHYKGREVMTKYSNGAGLANQMGIKSAKLSETFREYNEIMSSVLKDPDGGKYDAYPSGKTHDPHGKKFFLDRPISMDEALHVSIVTPVIHYCMGGLQIDSDSRVMGPKGAIRGLYAAGEVAGGVHGNNRLGGSSLLDCVVFGRVAAEHAARFAMGNNIRRIHLSSITAKEEVRGIPSDQERSTKIFTIEEVRKHAKKDDCWVVLHGQVMDLTSFLPKHPGGEVAILTFAGKDATKEFDMIHPPDVVDKYLDKACILGFVEGAQPNTCHVPTDECRNEMFFTKEDVSKHSSPEDLWIIIHDMVYNITDFLKDHPGGKNPLIKMGGKDATKEFLAFHGEAEQILSQHGEKYRIGRVGRAPLIMGLSRPLLADTHWWGENRNTAANFGPVGPSVYFVYTAVFALIKLFFFEVLWTIFSVAQLRGGKITDKSGITRTAIFLIFFVLIHAVGNLHVFAGPDAFNGYAYFLNRPVPWGTLLLPVEIYLLLAGVLHVIVGVARTIAFKEFSMLTEARRRSELQMAISGSILLIFLVVHIQQFRIVAEYPSYSFRTKWMYPFYCDRQSEDCEVATFKDLYAMEFRLFENRGWVLFYLVSVYYFLTHMGSGLNKIINATHYVHRPHKPIARFIATCACYFIALCYFSYPIYCYFFPVKDWNVYNKEHVESWE